MMKKVIKDIFSKSMFSLPKKLREVHKNLPFLPERIKIEKVEQVVANLHGRIEFVIRITNLN